MKQVIEEQTKLTASQNQLFQKIDFHDTFATTNHEDTLEEITNHIFNTTPNWIKALFTLRNNIARLIGLKTEIPKDYNENFKVGGYLKKFKIYALSENEVILGADDTHLNFRAIVMNNHKAVFNIKVITLVEYNNQKGKIYMGFIKPFHRLVVRRMVKNACIKKTYA